MLTSIALYIYIYINAHTYRRNVRITIPCSLGKLNAHIEHSDHSRKGKGGSGIRTYNLWHAYDITYPLSYKSNHYCNQLNTRWKAYFFPSLGKNHENAHFLPRDGKKLTFQLQFNWFMFTFGLWPNRFDIWLLPLRSRVRISVTIFLLSVKKALVTVALSAFQVS